MQRAALDEPAAACVEGVTTRGLVVRYGEVTAVDGLDLDAVPGRVLGVLGSNGAGKSSLLRAIAGVTPPAGGSVLVAGHDMSTVAGSEAARAVLGYCPDVGGLIRQATVREHIAASIAFAGTGATREERWAEAMSLAADFDLLSVFDRTTGGFSHGMSRRVSVLLALLAATKVLVLDEPFDGVDPLGVDAMLAAIAGRAERGLTVLLSTHLRELLVRASDEIVVMSQGRQLDRAGAADFADEGGRSRYEHALRTAHGE